MNVACARSAVSMIAQIQAANYVSLSRLQSTVDNSLHPYPRWTENSVLFASFGLVRISVCREFMMCRW